METLEDLQVVLRERGFQDPKVLKEVVRAFTIEELLCVEVSAPVIEEPFPANKDRPPGCSLVKELEHGESGATLG